MNDLSLLSQVPFPWQASQWQRLSEQWAQGKLPHAFLFSGASGTGKALLARQFGRLLLCQSPVQNRPCGHCRNCRSAGGSHPDILLVRPEEGARDITIASIRALADFAAQTSHAGLFRVIIIDQAHRMNRSAANALLKTLEEPGTDTCLILITDLPGFLPATIRSRCQRCQFPAPEFDVAVAWLEHQIQESMDLPAILAMAECRPLLALELAESDALGDRQAFMQGLDKLAQGAISPNELIRQFNALGDKAVVEYFIVAASVLSKSLLGGPLEQTRQAGLGALAQRLAQRQNQLSLQRALLQRYQEAVQAKRQLLSTANPNGQLITESLLWHWFQLLR